MYANNQTQEWVEEQTAGDRERLFTIARKMARTTKKLSHQHRQLIEEQRVKKTRECKDSGKKTT